MVARVRVVEGVDVLASWLFFREADICYYMYLCRLVCSFVGSLVYLFVVTAVDSATAKLPSHPVLQLEEMMMLTNEKKVEPI